jgi:DNA-binding transcriptional regulator YiaG
MTPTDVRAWRQRLGLTQAQAAEALGVSTRAIQAYEGGDYEPGKPVVRLMEAIEREATQGD